MTLSSPNLERALLTQKELRKACPRHTRQSVPTLYVTAEVRRRVEDNRIDDAPPWMREDLPKVREALESLRFLTLPTKRDVHEWAIMSDFSCGQENGCAGEELLDTIHAPGAFRMFRSTIRRLGIEKAWYQFRGRASEEIAREWLEDYNLPYKQHRRSGEFDVAGCRGRAEWFRRCRLVTLPSLAHSHSN
jgi:hypothetical protein